MDIVQLSKLLSIMWNEESNQSFGYKDEREIECPGNKFLRLLDALVSARVVRQSEGQACLFANTPQLVTQVGT